MRFYFREKLAVTLNAIKEFIWRGLSYLFLSFLLLVTNNEFNGKRTGKRHFTILTGAYHCRQNESPVLPMVWAIECHLANSFIKSLFIYWRLFYVEPSERKHEEEIVKIFLFLEHIIWGYRYDYKKNPPCGLSLQRC